MSAGMAAATLDGRKTTFREVVTPQPFNTYVSMAPHPDGQPVWLARGHVPYEGGDLPGDVPAAWRCPYGVPGDRLYVQEPWNKHGAAVTYLADGDWIADHNKAAPPAHYRPQWNDADTMPEEYARLVLEIVSVQAKQLQAISPEQAAAEGMFYDKAKRRYVITEGDEYKGRSTSCAREAFYMLWESMRTGYMWTANPWVWVVEFKVIETNIRCAQ